MSGPPVDAVEAFRARARAWIRAHLGAAEVAVQSLRARSDEEELAGVKRDREIQRMLFDAGLAGLCFPREYGGQGLTPAHQRALNEELSGFEYPMRLQAPTMTPCASVLLEYGTEEQKRRHLPAILRGDEAWMQFLSEPTNGSDVAGALCTAVQDGDEWVLNGSKIWTTGAWWSDWGLLLARTNWDVPKHRGLTVFILPIHQPGLDVHRIEMLNGNREFCQEFLSDVRVPDSDRIGAANDGWTVATRWLFHERMLYNSPFITAPDGAAPGSEKETALQVARDAGQLDNPMARGLVGESITLGLVGNALRRRISDGIAGGALSDQSAAVSRLFTGLASARRATISFEIAGAMGAAWVDGDGLAAESGTDYLMRQANSIGGGTTEIARNVIAERVLKMPREQAPDRDVPFRDAPRGSARP
jgi:alkylation response protein AidB-like acyl-CoA dehydrogenase